MNIVFYYSYLITWVVIIINDIVKAQHPATGKRNVGIHSMFYLYSAELCNHTVNVFDVQVTDCTDRPAVPPRLPRSYSKCETLPLQV